MVYLDVRGVEIPLLSTVSISNCRYQEAPGEVVWSECTDRYEGQEERVDQAMASRKDWKRRGTVGDKSRVKPGWKIN